MFVALTWIAHNLTFVIDCSHFPDRIDVLVDDLGVWVLNVSRKTWFSASISDHVSVNIDDSGDYIMHRAWYYHGTSKDLQKLSVSIEGISWSIIVYYYALISCIPILDPSATFLNLVLIAYTFTGKEHEVLVKPHGNSHKGQPYQKTLPSNLNNLKMLSKNKINLL